LQNSLVQLLVFRLHYLGHENSALSLFVGAELDPRGKSEPMEARNRYRGMIGMSRGLYYDLTDGPDSGQI
jgi:hypothetical protein